jgi:hypothetical protein
MWGKWQTIILWYSNKLKNRYLKREVRLWGKHLIWGIPNIFKVCWNCPSSTSHWLLVEFEPQFEIPIWSLSFYDMFLFSHFYAMRFICSYIQWLAKPLQYLVLFQCTNCGTCMHGNYTSCWWQILESQPLVRCGHLDHMIWPRGSEDMSISRQGYHYNSFVTIDMDSRISVK